MPGARPGESVGLHCIAAVRAARRMPQIDNRGPIGAASLTVLTAAATFADASAPARLDPRSDALAPSSWHVTAPGLAAAQATSPARRRAP